MVSTPDSLLRAVETAARDDGFALDRVQRAVLETLVQAATRALAGERTRGVYVHGPAGRGKSWLADALCAALPPASATRVHFHGFFDDLHRRIQARRSEPDATARALDDVLGESRLVFFDELHVHDPGDARLLTRLLRQLVQQGRTLVATSNYAPGELLPDPVWHHLFVPGIALLTAHLDIRSLDGLVDYRTLALGSRTGFRAGTWSTSAGRAVPTVSQRLVVRDRTFTVSSAQGQTLTATFDQLCDAPVSAIEYRHWSREYQHWIVTGVPPLDEVGGAAGQRFANLVDVLVDADVPLDVYAGVDLEQFLRRAAGRSDAFRMGSRLHLLRPE